MSFVKGDVAHVEFDGTVVNPDNDYDGFYNMVQIKDSDGLTHFVYLNSNAIVRTGPAWWPPQAGDIWEADGGEYYVRNRSINGPSFVVCPFDAGAESTSYTDGLGEFKALNPTLIRRRGA